MLNKIIAFAAMLQAETEARMRAGGSHESTIAVHAKTAVKEGKKYAKVDIGSSGRYMVEMSTGNIFGIKAYGQIHKGHFYGTVDTINDYCWGEYYPIHKTNPVGCCKWSVPKLTFAPQPVATV